MKIIGDVTDKDVLLIDDIVDTAGTITKAADLMKESGARSVRALASHAVMSDPATRRVDQSALSEIIFTDSIPYTKKSEKVTILSVAAMFAESIHRVCHNESISSLYTIK
jgi:ribose-phosphate pyrophosphokinase